MKTAIISFAVCISFCPLNAQLKTTPVCPAFNVDILAGRINDLKPNSTGGQIKKAFPCFTSAEDEGTETKCGSNVFYKDKDIYFYTGRDYVEIGEKFKGKLSLPLMGAARNGLFKWLGHPKIKDVNWDAFQTAYGTLVLYYNKAGKINKLQFSTLSSETLTLCE
ncbi:MAG: hypothetical protein ACT4OJ_11860 [Bacteroidota bacterium]